MAQANPWSAYIDRIREAHTPEALDTLEHELFGRKEGAMTLAMKALKDLDAEGKKQQAQELNTWKKQLTETIAEQRTALLHPSDDALVRSDAMDITLSLPPRERGSLHLIPSFMEHAADVFGRMGFDVATGPEVESEEMNFDMLNIPPNHPARDAQDTFWVQGEDKRVLRTHTSPVQIRYMRNHKPPLRMICMGKVYRKDADATHSPVFHQLEGLMIGKDVSLANMKAVMVNAVRELLGRDVEYRFRTGYFPFVEPGLEMDIRWQGDEQTREGNWLEVVGCGMVHPNVLKNCGIDVEEVSGVMPRQLKPTWQGFAFGFGIDRLVMIKHQIPSIKMLFEGDVRFLRQF